MGESDYKKVWVAMTDLNPSDVDDRIQKLVIICDNLQEAKIVQENARTRADMEFINIRFRKPYYNSNFYYVRYIDKTINPNWFIPNYFLQSKLIN